MEVDPLSSRFNRSDDWSIEGMESVVATVSGYHGSERFNLIKLISHSGASYVGAMSRSTTHLVCWKFEGKKYNLAKKFKTIIVNHRWVEDCIKQRKRLPEHPYMLQSGQEIGPLLLEIPLVTKKHEVSDRSYLDVDSKNEEIDMGCGGSGPAGWTDSFLLNENLLPKFGKSEGNSHKSKLKPFKRASKQEQRSDTRYCFQDPPLSGLIIMEFEDSSSDSSIHSMRGKRKILKHEESSMHSSLRQERGKSEICKGISSSSLAKPSGKGRKLVKKSIGGDVLESILSDSGQAEPPIFRIGETSENGFHKNGGRNEDSEDIEDIVEIEERDFSAALERVTQDGCSDFENLNGAVKNTDQIDHAIRSPTSMELSCVICWTEFSSTRGVLPCGHRFCYSCIQNWADRMVSMRKASTCPLCKASFVTITKVEGAATSDQKIYSQTIPCAPSTMDICILPDQYRASVQPSLLPACSECRSREPEDLLIRCHLCQVLCIHSYCLDPPLLPWTCIHCKDLQMLYNHNH